MEYPDNRSERLTLTDEILFTEQQKFKQWWVMLILFGVNGLFFYGAWQQIMEGQRFGNRPMSNTGLLITMGLITLITVLVLSCRLDTIIRKDGIYVRFFPFHLKFKHYAWDRLLKAYVRKYSPIGEYGGWGIRFGLSGRGKAFNITGNKGLQLIFKTNKKLLIGTQKPDEMAEALIRLGALKE